MIAYLRDEPGGTVVDSFLINPAERCYAHSINLLEVFYEFVRRHGEAAASEALEDLAAAGVIERRDMDQPFLRRVGLLKARGRISLADCFCIALAEETQGQVVTSDHHEFDVLAQSGVVPVRFIR
jgi:predicted nucleic acid-binding protein